MMDKPAIFLRCLTGFTRPIPYLSARINVLGIPFRYHLAFYHVAQSVILRRNATVRGFSYRKEAYTALSRSRRLVLRFAIKRILCLFISLIPRLSPLLISVKLNWQTPY